jgi:hypothetical protein
MRSRISLWLLAAVCLGSSLAEAQVGIADIGFDTVPPDTTFSATGITLAGPTTVEGDLTLQNGAVAFEPAAKGVLQFAAGDFTPDLFQAGQPMLAFQSGYYVVTMTNTIYGATGALHLPSGAVIDAITCYVYDADATVDFHPTTAKVFVRRRLATDTVAESIATIPISTTGSSTTLQARTDPTFVEHTFDIAYAYDVRVLFALTSSPATVDNLRFYGCTLEYSLARLAP